MNVTGTVRLDRDDGFCFPKPRATGPPILCTPLSIISQKSMKVSLYARVSMDENQDDRRYQDPENQLQPLRDFCKSMQYDITEEFVDKESGGNPNRPEFRRMMHEASMCRFNGIVVWKLDRFSREGVLSTLAYIKQLKDRHVWLKSMTESWLDTSQEGITEIVLAIMSWVAYEERKKISERTKAGIQRRKNIGQWHGGRPKKGSVVAKQ